GTVVVNTLDFVSTGVADAMVTTQLGMITAIPGLLMYTYLRGRRREFAYAVRPSLQDRLDSDRPPGIDLAPMLDTVFNLLIFFIIASAFVKESAIDIEKPQAVTASRLKNDF